MSACHATEPGELGVAYCARCLAPDGSPEEWPCEVQIERERGDAWRELVRQDTDEIAKLRARLLAVIALHPERTHQGAGGIPYALCACGESAPCPTRRAATESTKD